MSRMIRAVATPIGALMAVLLVALAAMPAAAQDWPARPVTMVVPFAAGSGSDILGRIIGPRLGEHLGAAVIVEDVGGAGGMIGAARVMKAAPDGYQVLLATAGTHAINQTLYKKPLYNAATDFTPVVLVASTPILLITRKDLPANNLPEFIAYAKAHQATMQYGSPGAGSTSHLGCALFNAAIKVEVTHVPYRSTGQALQDLLAGRLDYQCVPIAGVVPQIEGKLVKAIAIMSRQRSSILPMLATAHEQGLTDFEVETWYAIFLPKATPPAIVQKLHDAAVAAMDAPDVQARLAELGIEVVAPERRSSDYLAGFVVREIEKWAG
ncbi:MAG TPA: tripartite tricarboxylate transporter substrate binding protein, partial [Xanthobacteraceae bacterium]|nr:tripartite tricarboxylate transporter substrate binding protein [Xanthobacteraceae bacterium]